jgi:hypothetical protein
VTAPTREWLDSLAVPGRPDEHEAKRLLAGHGLRVPASLCVAAGRQGGVQPPEPRFEGPYVVKVRSADVLHKTDGGGVLLGVNRAGLAPAIDVIRGRFPDSGALVEEQVTFAGPEFIVGAFRDAVFGPAVMVGAGGILTELYRDVAFRLVPCTRREALRMLRELALFPALENFRGLAMDAGGLAGVVAAVSRLVEDLGDCFSQMDINPLVCTAGGWTVLDAKILLAPCAAPH